MATTAPKSEMEQDAHEWMNRVNATAKDHSGITNPTGSVPWYTPFFGCFDPIDTCAITCCCPCITFGKTHHRLRKDANLVGYNVINASCLGWWAASCVGLHCIPNLLQRGDVRERSTPHLTGNIATDFLKAWCCSCCDLIQQDKEAEHLLSMEKQTIDVQPTKSEAMAYGPQ